MDKESNGGKMTVNENFQQAYMMLLNSKVHLRDASYTWTLKEKEIEDLCNEISGIQDKVYELIHYFDEDDEYEWKKELEERKNERAEV